MGDVGISDVAARAGVSVGTVSNYFNRPEILATKTAERVRDAIVELGYVRNFAARDLRLGRARSIGLLVLDISNPFFTEFVEGVERVANDAGLAVILGNTKENAAKEASYLELFQEQRVAGVILSPIGDVSAQLAALHRQGTPTVLIDDAPDLENTCSVAVDDASGGALAVTHLLRTGRRRILILDGPARIHQARARIEGALHAARAAGVTVELVTVSAFTSEAAHEAVAELLARGAPSFDGIFAANDIMALGAIRALHENSIAIPGQVAVIGYDDISYASAVSPALSSIRQPSDLMGARATELLLDELNSPDEHHHERVIFPPELQHRQTT
ncbi:LacI family DNA-binding transcriptional regulator [Herbiconiux sp. A18JL235]|uniref:LacI family DNA-binding transcriptional regulator n=1 Tax=Herbiconiux sp. A18JL235 TaxID=3152363 RepID=A0AB39BG87_9MICO